MFTIMMAFIQVPYLSLTRCSLEANLPLPKQHTGKLLLLYISLLCFSVECHFCRDSRY